jgi:hypothetical protein
VPLPTTAPGGAEGESKPAQVSIKQMKRLVIYTANFAILVSNVESSMAQLREMIDEWGGYMQSSTLSTMTFRVPAPLFDKAVEQLSRMGVVTRKQVDAEDVTSQYRDLQLRLEVAENSRQRMLAILKNAEKMEDIIKIENEIRRLTEEIERIKQQLRSMADRILYSTITVEFQAKAPAVRPMRPGRARSYFDWINQIGAENVTRYF